MSHPWFLDTMRMANTGIFSISAGFAAARGEAGDDDETYEVDFLSKSYDHNQQRRQQSAGDGQYRDLDVDQGGSDAGACAERGVLLSFVSVDHRYSGWVAFARQLSDF